LGARAEFWKETSVGNAGGFYQRHMIAEGYVVIPSGVVSRDELIAKWNQHLPVTSYELSEPRFTLVDGSNVVLNYHVRMSADWLPDVRRLDDRALHLGGRRLGAGGADPHARSGVPVLTRPARPR
jgi:hypothetical protein